MVSFTPQPLYAWGKNPQYPLDRRLGGPQSQSEYDGESWKIRVVRSGLDSSGSG